MSTRSILEILPHDVIFIILGNLSSKQLYQLRIISSIVRDIVIETFRRKSRYPELYSEDKLNLTLHYKDEKQLYTKAKLLYRKVISDYYLTCKHKPPLYGRQIGVACHVDVIALYSHLLGSTGSIVYLLHGACRYSNIKVLEYIAQEHPKLIDRSISYFKTYLYYAARNGKNNYETVIKIFSDKHVERCKRQIIFGACISGDIKWINELLTFDNIMGVMGNECMSGAYKHDLYNVCELLSTVMCPDNDTFDLACKQENIRYVNLWLKNVHKDLIIKNLYRSITNELYITVKFIIENYPCAVTDVAFAIGTTFTPTTMEMFDWLLSYVHKNKNPSDVFRIPAGKYVSGDITNCVEYLRSGYRVNNSWLDTYIKTECVTKNISYSINLHEYLCIKLIKSLDINDKYYEENIESVYALCNDRGYNVNHAFVR